MELQKKLDTLGGGLYQWVIREGGVFAERLARSDGEATQIGSPGTLASQENPPSGCSESEFLDHLKANPTRDGNQGPDVLFYQGGDGSVYRRVTCRGLEGACDTDAKKTRCDNSQKPAIRVVASNRPAELFTPTRTYHITCGHIPGDVEEAQGELPLDERYATPGVWEFSTNALKYTRIVCNREKECTDLEKLVRCPKSWRREVDSTSVGMLEELVQPGWMYTVRCTP